MICRLLEKNRERRDKQLQFQDYQKTARIQPKD